MSLAEQAQRPVLELLPHALPMALLNRSVRVGEDGYEAEVDIKADTLFCGPQGVPAWVGLEYMAQSIAAYAGAEARAAGQLPKVGFLLGTREFRPKSPYFKVGSCLRIRVKKVLHDPQGLSVLDCSLSDAQSGELLAQSNLTVYEVADLDRYMKENVK
jgi:predicted hotdog family 3-hydroxylacyl-ACP dehydratase